MWELDYKESWALKNWTVVNCSELWCWRRLLRVPWTARRSNQSILKISPRCSLEGVMLKLKLQYFGQLMWRDPDAGKDWGQEEKGTTEDEMVGWCHRHNGHGFGWTPGVGDGQGGLACWVHGIAKSRTQLGDWTDWRTWCYFSQSYACGFPVVNSYNALFFSRRFHLCLSCVPLSVFTIYPYLTSFLFPALFIRPDESFL